MFRNVELVLLIYDYVNSKQTNLPQLNVHKMRVCLCVRVLASVPSVGLLVHSAPY